MAKLIKQTCTSSLFLSFSFCIPSQLALPSLSRFVSIPISSFDSICHNTTSFRTFSPSTHYPLPSSAFALVISAYQPSAARSILLRPHSHPFRIRTRAGRPSLPQALPPHHTATRTLS
ncbi:hypothetical protein C8F01DRAFT_275064 [Mycena amicta]|nr:hypothetical protein C8F01DRAFT_275064 [Mycena amicta]